MIYIQSHEDRPTVPHHFDAACAMYGAIEQDLKYRLINYSEIDKFQNLIKTNLFVGSSEFMLEIFKRVGYEPNLPNSDRQHVILPLKDVRTMVLNGDSLFVKPLSKNQKLFSGIVLDKYMLSYVREYADDLEVMVYNVLPKILSEWRVYILHNQIVDAKNYSGDFKIGLKYSYVEKKIAEFKDRLPVAYVMDVGVCEKEQCIIEFNDMYAIGNYGIDNKLYLRMLRERYFEIIRYEK